MFHSYCYDKERVDKTQFSNIGHLKEGVRGTEKTNLLVNSYQYDSLCIQSSFEDVRVCVKCYEATSYLANFTSGINRCHSSAHIPFGFGQKTTTYIEKGKPAVSE